MFDSELIKNSGNPLEKSKPKWMTKADERFEHRITLMQIESTNLDRCGGSEFIAQTTLWYGK